MTLVCSAASGDEHVSMSARNVRNLWVAVTVVMTAGVAVAQPNIAGKSDGDRLQAVQEEFLNIVGNVTSSVKDVEELMTMLHSRQGRQMGRLLLEGVMLGAAHKDSGALLAEFWTQLHGKLSPEFQDKMKDYTDFFSSFEIGALPYFLEQMFKKDETGKSMADIPMGQLVDMVQPTASKYGVDLRAFINSMLGKGNNNAKDLIFAALDNLNITTLFQLFNPPTGNEVRTTDSELEPTDTKPKGGENFKKGRRDSNLRLFRPLVASLLRENKIDLDADAVLQVLAPLLSGDLMSQIAPLLAAFGSQAGDGLGPVLLNLLGGEKGMGKHAQPGGLLGVMGTLLARGNNNNNNVDLEGMLTMASMFINMNNQQGERKARPSKPKEPEMGGLADLAGVLLENKDVNNLLRQANNFLASNSGKNVPSRKSKESDVPKPREQKPEKSAAHDKPKQLTDLIEPILRAMSTDKQGARKVKDLILFGNAFLARNANIGGFVQQISAFLSMYSMDAAKEKKFQELQKLLANHNLESVQWARVFESLHAEETRSTLIKTMTPTLSEFVLQLGSKEAQQNIYKVAEHKVQAVLASYGLKGVTLKSFPDRLAPLVKQMTAAWRLPINPATQLQHLRDYLQLLLEWVSEGMADMKSLPSREDVHKVVRNSLTTVGDRVVGVHDAVRGASPQCLPLVICRLNAGLDPSSLPAAATRAASLVFATSPVLEEDDPSLLLRVVQAASGKVENCKETLGGECPHNMEEDDDQYQSYEHMEL